MNHEIGGTVIAMAIHQCLFGSAWHNWPQSRNRVFRPEDVEDELPFLRRHNRWRPWQGAFADRALQRMLRIFAG